MKRLKRLWQRHAPEVSEPSDAVEATPEFEPVDLQSPAFFADPYPVYNRLRSAEGIAPVVQGGFLLTRHADVEAALKNPALGNTPSRFSALSARNADKYVAADLARNIPPFLDMPDHKTPRQALSRAFYQTFGPFKDGLADMARAQAARAPVECEVIADLAQPFVLRAMAHFVGLPHDPERLAPLSEAFFHLFAPLRDPEQFAAVNARLAEFRALVADAMQAPQQGSLIENLKVLQADGMEMTNQMIADNAILVFADGIENIQAGVATLMPIGADGFETTEDFVREALRLDTPGQIVPRVAREGTEIAGVTIDAGIPVFLALGAANRDPEMWDEADTMKPGRDLSKALIFGQGRHRCIGEPLGVAMLGAMVDAVRERGVVQCGKVLGYHQRMGHRWPTALPVTLA